MAPKKTGLSYWASAWVVGLVGLLTAVLWPQAWAQVRLAEPGEGSQRGWWADQATLRARERFQRALSLLDSEAWARQRALFLRSLHSASDDDVLKSLGMDLADSEVPSLDELTPPPPATVVEAIVNWAVGHRLPTEYELRHLVEERASGNSSVVSMRMDGVNLAVGIPLSSQVSLRGAVLADFVMAAPIFSDRGFLGGTDLYRYFNNLGYSLGFDMLTGGGEVVFGRMIVRGTEVNPAGIAAPTTGEPLFLGVMVGTTFDPRWQAVPTSGAR